MALRKCSIEGCGKPHVANDLCAMHNRRKQRHGDPLFINPKCNRDGNYIKRARKNTAQWKKDNKITYNAYLATCKKRVRQATPSWVDRDELIRIHVNKPQGYEVDHILPVNGDLISGLNVPWNLRYLTEKENGCKSNKFDGTYENESWRKDIK